MLCCDCERTLCFQTGRARLDLQCSVGYGIVSVKVVSLQLENTLEDSFPRYVEYTSETKDLF